MYGVCPGDSYELIVSMTQPEFRDLVDNVQVGPIFNRECDASEFEGISSTGFPECTRYTCEKGSYFDLNAATAGECSVSGKGWRHKQHHHTIEHCPDWKDKPINQCLLCFDDDCQPLNADGGTFNGECCILCPQGTASNTENALSCQLCEPGTFSDLEGLQECIACATGTYQELAGQVGAGEGGGNVVADVWVLGCWDAHILYHFPSPAATE